MAKKKTKRKGGSKTSRGSLSLGISGMSVTKIRTLMEPASSLCIPTDEKRLAKESEKKQDRFFCVLGTNIWRLKQRMLAVDTNEPKEEYSRIYRYVESIDDALAEYGVKVEDHDGQTYSEGLPLKVITFEKKPGLKKEEIVETLKPTIKLKNRFLQIGEVVIGIPE